MKEQYIKQVEKELCLPRNEKKEVVRDLNEVFASALEHGETEQQVMIALHRRNGKGLFRVLLPLLLLLQRL